MRSRFFMMLTSLCLLLTAGGAFADTYHGWGEWGEYRYTTDSRVDLHTCSQLFGRGEMVELEDGSRYTILWGDQWRVRRWMTGDPLYITANQGYLFGLISGSTELCLYNGRTGETVEANITAAPFLYGPHSFWIASVDSYGGFLVLGDGRAVEIHPDDRFQIYNWEAAEHLLMGTNTGSGHHRYPLYIINTSSVNGVRARVL